jgi:hypothetical protein
MSVSGLPFDDFRVLLQNLPGPDPRALVAARERDAQLTKPPGALGRLEEIAFWLAAWTGRPPAVNRPLVAIFAGNHGVTRHGVTPFPSSVTQQMVENFAAGGAAINQICVSTRPRPQDLRSGARLSDRRYHRAKRLSPSATAPRPWPSAWKRSPAARICCASARWASATPRSQPPSTSALYGGDGRGLGRPRHRFGWRGAHGAQDRRGRRRPLRMPQATTCPIRWRSCAASAAARSRRWRAQSSPRGSQKVPGPASTATWRPRPRRSSRPPTRRRSTIA